MSEEEAFQAKLKFLADAEGTLRRRLTQAERFLLSKVVSQILDRMTLDAGNITASDANFELLDKVSQIYAEFVKSHMLPIAANLATAFLEIPSLNSRYYAILAPTKRMKDLIQTITQGSADYIRSKIGLDAEGNLKPGGYLQELAEDTTIRNELRRIMATAVEGEVDLQGLRRQLRNYLQGTPELQRIEGEPVPAKPGALEKRFDKEAFDTLQEADRNVNLRMSDKLGLQFAVYRGGIIERTRRWCCERNDKVWTRDEMETFNDSDWPGKKGDCEIFGGGHRCRHVWMFIATTRGLKARPDIKEIRKPRQAPVLEYVDTPQGYNEDCDERR